MHGNMTEGFTFNDLYVNATSHSISDDDLYGTTQTHKAVQERDLINSGLGDKVTSSHTSSLTSGMEGWLSQGTHRLRMPDQRGCRLQY